MRKSGSALVVCSGGLDSTVALYWATARYKKVEALTFKYGQNHAKRENAAVKAICKKENVPLTVIDLGFIGKHFKSALLGGKIPEGHYAAKNMASTVVPFRNGIMLAVHQLHQWGDMGGNWRTHPRRKSLLQSHQGGDCGDWQSSRRSV